MGSTPIVVTRGDSVTGNTGVSKTLVLGSNPSPLACGAVDKLVKSPVFQAGFLRVRVPSALLLPYRSMVEQQAVNLTSDPASA